MAKKIDKPDYGTLYFLYIKQNFSQRAIAKNFNVSQSTVQRWLKSYDIVKCHLPKYTIIKLAIKAVFNKIVKVITNIIKG